MKNKRRSWIESLNEGKREGGETKEKRRQAAAGNQNIKGGRSKEKNVETNEDKHHLNQRA